MKRIKQLREICKTLSLKVHDIATFTDGVIWGDGDNHNKSWCAGNEIWLGIYDDERMKLISFFHELGHHFLKQEFKKLTKYNTLMIELKCWEIGIGYALNQCRIIFDDDVLAWGYGQALTYVGHDARERKKL
jgi:hypothetical protein